MHKRQVQPGPQLEYYDIKAAAAFLSIGTTTIYRAIEERQIKHARIGKSIRISHENLCNWVEEQTKPTLAELKVRGLGGKFKRRHTTPGKKIRTVGRPPICPPMEIEDYRKLAKRIEKKMMKEEMAH